jgi:TRAP-type uncharacterized transport system fused permease subunit
VTAEATPSTTPPPRQDDAPVWLRWTVAVLASVMVVACILWNVEAPTRMGVAILTQQYMAFQLGLALTLAYLRFGFRGEARKPRVGWIDGAIALTAFACSMRRGISSGSCGNNPTVPGRSPSSGAVVCHHRGDGGHPPPRGVDAVRHRGRVSGLRPVSRQGAGRSDRKGAHARAAGAICRLRPLAVFSTPLAVGTIIVLLFVFFGRLLFAAGGGSVLHRPCHGATGRSRGGSAKISVVGSALFGSISGSAVSNVVTTGVVTIPLMQRGGYSKRDAARSRRWPRPAAS